MSFTKTLFNFILLGILLRRGNPILGFWSQFLIPFILLPSRWGLFRKWPFGDTFWQILGFHGFPNGGRKISSNQSSWWGNLLAKSRSLASSWRFYRGWWSKWKPKTVNLQSLLEYDQKWREIRKAVWNFRIEVLWTFKGFFLFKSVKFWYSGDKLKI